ncbi:hypothetical protein [Acinetobacter sp. Marseille-Q1623]|uniref:hypothetical protein n=1 Tax=Acinetobacter sp. Marseille-Q1623 TaxID=2697501 RepID=UPI00157A38B5|nr:hypothetical protein [Acinetobacter sp. Marseille-Q1623]
MKFIYILLAYFSFGLISLSYASSTTNSIRTSAGQLISIGDSYIHMVDKIQQEPLLSRSYEVKNQSEKYTVNELTYLIDNVYYTISIINGSIKEIKWDRKN